VRTSGDFLGTGAEIGLGFTPLGVVVDVNDLRNAIAEGSGWGIAIAVVGFLPFGDFLKGGRKLARAGDDVIDAGGDVSRRLDNTTPNDAPSGQGSRSPEGLDDVAKTADDFIDLTGHRSDHILNRHRAGAGKPGKTEFPVGWSDERILHEISDIATDPNAVTGVGKWNSPFVIGTRDGIEIRVDFYPSNHPTHAGKISTAYPINVKRNPG